MEPCCSSGGAPVCRSRELDRNWVSPRLPDLPPLRIARRRPLFDRQTFTPAQNESARRTGVDTSERTIEDRIDDLAS